MKWPSHNYVNTVYKILLPFSQLLDFKMIKFCPDLKSLQGEILAFVFI